MPANPRKPNRLKGYNYSKDGWYFVTICVKNRIKCLGEIKDEKMEYSRYGDIVSRYWQEIPQHYKNVFLDQWIIMPNHIHGIIVINTENDGNVGNVGNVGTAQCAVQNAVHSVQPVTYNTQTEQCPVSTSTRYGLLSKIIKSFKEISLKTIRKNYNDYEFKWQRSFYDRIIRKEDALEKIHQYIYHNPAKWEFDKNNLENLWM